MDEKPACGVYKKIQHVFSKRFIFGGEGFVPTWFLTL